MNPSTVRMSYHNIFDWNCDEDRSRISKGYDPENMTRFRRFAISIIKSKGVRRSIAQKCDDSHATSSWYLTTCDDKTHASPTLLEKGITDLSWHVLFPPNAGG